MRYADRPGKSAVERFMQFYFLNAKAVGDLTGLFLAQLDEQMGDKGRRFALPTLPAAPEAICTASRSSAAGFPSRTMIGSADDPCPFGGVVRSGCARGTGNPPQCHARGSRDARLVDRVRDDPAANAFFLDVLTARERPTWCFAG